MMFSFIVIVLSGLVFGVAGVEKLAGDPGGNVQHEYVGSVQAEAWEQLDEVRTEVGEEDYKRAKFVLGEKDRVLAVCDALNEGDYEKVGEMMYKTHGFFSILTKRWIQR